MDTERYTVAAAQGHGKACKGCKRTSTVQVREALPSGYLIKKQFRFTMGDRDSLRRATFKALRYVQALQMFDKQNS